jgi:hypothetical protein
MKRLLLFFFPFLFLSSVTQAKEGVDVTVSISSVYSHAWDDDWTTHHRMRFKAMINGGDYGSEYCYENDTNDRDTWWYWTQQLQSANDLNHIPKDVTVWFQGFEDEGNKDCTSESNDRHRYDDYFTIDLDFAPNTDHYTTISLGDGFYKARVKIRYTIPTPLSPVNAYRESNPEVAATNLCEGEKYFIKAKDPLDTEFNLKKENFEYVWEYHYVGNEYTEKYDCHLESVSGANEVDCGMAAASTTETTTNNLTGPIELIPDGCGSYDPDCFTCVCKERQKYVWYTLGTSADNRFDISSAFRTQNFNKIMFRYKLRPKGTSFTGNGRFGSYVKPSAPAVTVLDPPPVIIHASNTTSKYYSQIQDTLYNVVGDGIRIDHVQCKGESTGSFTIKHIAGEGNYYYNIRGPINTGSEYPHYGPPTYGFSGSGLVGPDKGNSASWVSFPEALDNTKYPTVVNGFKAGTYVVLVENLDEKPDDKPGLPTAGQRYCYNYYYVIIKEPQDTVGATHDPQLDFKGFDVSWRKGNDGEVAITGSGGITPYTYHLKAGNGDYTSQESGVFSGLKAYDDAGTTQLNYTYYVVDALGCASSTKTFKLSAPALISFNADVDVTDDKDPRENSFFPIECKGDSGKIVIAISGGVPPYKVLVDDVVKIDSLPAYPAGGFSASGIIQGIKAGLHTVEVRDANFEKSAYAVIKEGSERVELTEPTVIAIKADSIPPSCYNGSNGKIIVSAFGGIPHLGNGSEEQYKFFINAPYMDGPDSTDNYLTEATFTGLIPGRYEIEVFGKYRSCVYQYEVEVPQPSNYIQLAEPVVTNAVCKDEENGKIFIQVTGGVNGPFQVYLDGDLKGTIPAGEFTYTFENLVSREEPYLIEVDHLVDEQLCSTSTTASVGEPEWISGSIAMTPTNCFGDAEGSVLTANFSGGNGNPDNWTYTWYRVEEDTLAEQVGTGKEIIDKPAGIYRVQVVDALGCTQWMQKTITQPDPITFTARAITQSCEAVKDGRISVGITSEVLEPMFRLSWIDENGIEQSEVLNDQNGEFDSLAAGDYTIVLEDLIKGCVADTTLTIRVNTLSLSIDRVQHIGCYGDSTGLFQATLSGASPNFTPTYKLNNLQTDEITDFAGEAFGLKAGFYTVTATANEGCFLESDTIEITQPDKLIVTATEVKSAYCGNANGAVAASISGGTEPYTIEWSVMGGGPAPDPAALAAGTYQVLVTDAMNCIARDTVVVQNLESEIALQTSLIHYTCQKNGGSIRMELAGDAAPFSLAVVKEGRTDTLQLFTNLAAGETFIADKLDIATYSLKIKDSNGCTLEQTESISENPIWIDAAGISPGTCEQNNGSYTINIIGGGTPPYSLQWDSRLRIEAEVDTMTALDLYGGTLYSVWITDASGCSKEFKFKVDNVEGPQINLVESSLQASYCGQPTGSARVEGSGGTGTLTYFWKDAEEAVLASGTDLLEIDTLRAGHYYVEVQDATGCKNVVDFEINDLPDPKLTLSLLDSTACNLPLGRAEAVMSEGEEPYSYAWYNADEEEVAISAIAEGLLQGRYTVIATDARGCMQIDSIYIPQKANPQIWQRATEDASCGLATGWAEVGSRGGTGTHTYVWQDAEGDTLPAKTARAEGLFMGTYTVNAVDANGCASGAIEITIGEKTGLSIYQAANQPASCAEGADGVLEVVIDGGTSPYTYLWNDAAAQTTARAEGLAAGTYTVVVTDVSGCSLSRSLEVKAPAALGITNWSVEIPACAGEWNGSLYARVEGGTAPYSYAWYAAEGKVLEEQTSATAKGLAAGIYTLTVSDAQGCTFSESYELPDREPLTTTGIPSGAVICNGQTYVLDAGSGWASYAWSSDLGFSSTSQRVELTNAGHYYLEAVNHRGCVVQDTFLLEVSNDALTADFLMASRGYVGDTLVLIDISWPVPTQVNWQYAQEEGFEIITNEDFVQELLFTEPGTYTVELESFLAECRSAVSKQIVIEEAAAAPPDAGARIGGKDLIYATRVYPNPSRGRFKVEVELTEVAPLRLEVLSIYTAEVLHVVSFEDKRKVEVPMDMSGLKDGLYLLRVVAGDSYKNIRFYIQQ